MNQQSSLQRQIAALEGNLSKTDMIEHINMLQRTLDAATPPTAPAPRGPGAKLYELERQLEKIDEAESRIREEKEYAARVALEEKQKYQLALERGIIALGQLTTHGEGVSCERCSHTQGCDCFQCRTLGHTCCGLSAPSAWENNLSDDIGYGRGVRPDRSSRSGFSSGWQKK